MTLNVYDSEIDAIHRVYAALNERAEGRQDYDAFEREIKDRFAAIGFKVVVNWYTAQGPDGRQIEGTLIPDVDICDRIDPLAEFDHDRQVHEVTGDLLGLGEGGVIKTGNLTDAQRATLDAHRKHRHHD